MDADAIFGLVFIYCVAGFLLALFYFFGEDYPDVPVAKTTVLGLFWPVAVIVWLLRGVWAWVGPALSKIGGGD